MRSKVLGAVLGLGLIGGSLLAGGPAKAAQVCQVAPNGAVYCYDNSSGGVNPGEGGVIGDDGSPHAAPAPVSPDVRDAAISRTAAENNLGAALHKVVTGLKDGGAYRQYQRGFVLYSTTTGAQEYQGGTIAWTAKSGAHALVGAIRTKWVVSGGMKGALGAPVAGETTGLCGGGASQAFRGGAIVPHGPRD